MTALDLDQVNALTQLRAFLADCWDWTHRVYYETGFNRKEAKPEVGSTYMCRYTSRILLELLSGVDPSWHLAGGTMQHKGGGTALPHWWIENDTTIIDLTADQFGWDAITICSVDDPRYARTPGFGHNRHIKGLGATTEQWKGVASRDWMEKDPQFQAIAAQSSVAFEAFCNRWKHALERQVAPSMTGQPTPAKPKARVSP